MQRKVADAKATAAKADGWRAALEQAQLRCEDAEADSRRQAQRRRELVCSYWPVIGRLRAAEEAVRVLASQVGMCRRLATDVCEAMLEWNKQCGMHHGCTQESSCRPCRVHATVMLCC